MSCDLSLATTSAVPPVSGHDHIMFGREFVGV
jgi:hypothetical protein